MRSSDPLRSNVSLATELPWFVFCVLGVVVLDWVTGLHLGSGWLLVISLTLVITVAWTYYGLPAAIKRTLRKTSANHETHNPPNQKGEAGASPSTVGDTHLPGGNDETCR